MIIFAKVTEKKVLNSKMFFCCLLFFILLGTGGTGTEAFEVSTSTPVLSIPENAGADLKCFYTADFGSPRVEWKFKDLQGSQLYVIFDNEPTEKYKGRVELYKDGLRFNTVTRKDTGEYICEVSSANNFGDVKIHLIVEVPPSVPVCGVPPSVTTGSHVVLTCNDPTGSPPSTYKWFKDGTPLPEDPSKFVDFKNFSYTVDSKKGTLTFPSVTKADAGKYSCMASNPSGPSQTCLSQEMIVYDVNVGGIVAGVIVALLLVILLALGFWFAFRKGYLQSKTERSQAGYAKPTPSTADEEDGEFKQKSSFVV
ncbi:junctional adhesion molecule A-like isoform X1 [Scleropages formosus]|uniref:Junctional adhesion molecule A n=1 Tax=Scleropages formosus TaxID=113540 RepID=A0A8C9QVM1_SCLFO|nr:junctional adhesion molecule A-like isoform X1 [Scleropages formosus]